MQRPCWRRHMSSLDKLFTRTTYHQLRYQEYGSKEPERDVKQHKAEEQNTQHNYQDGKTARQQHSGRCNIYTHFSLTDHIKIQTLHSSFFLPPRRSYASCGKAKLLLAIVYNFAVPRHQAITGDDFPYPNSKHASFFIRKPLNQISTNETNFPFKANHDCEIIQQFRSRQPNDPRLRELGPI